MSTQTISKSGFRFCPWLVGLLFWVGLEKLSWRLADWYVDKYLPWLDSSMRPVSPVIPNPWTRRNLPNDYGEVVYAKDQPEYNPLPSIKQSDGCVITRWKMNYRERFRVLLTGSVYLEVLTFNQPLQPLKMSTRRPHIEAPLRAEADR